MARGPKKRRAYKRRPSRYSHNQQNNGGGDKSRMLDVSRERVFRIELDELVEDSSFDKTKNTVAANVRTKAARLGIKDAEDYLGEVEGEYIEPEVSQKIKKLLKRYTKYR